MDQSPRFARIYKQTYMTSLYRFASRLLRLVALFFTFAATHAVEGGEAASYCDLEYRITQKGLVRNVKVISCSPAEIHSKYRSRSIGLIKRLHYSPKTIDGKAVETTNARVRIVYHDKYYQGVKTMLFSMDGGEFKSDSDVDYHH